MRVRINEKIKKCVAFLQLRKYDGSYEYIGTCFFISIQEQQHVYNFVVTAKHILDGIKNKHSLNEIFIKINLKNGSMDRVCIKIDDWISHQDEKVDVAVSQFIFQKNYDHLFYPSNAFMTDDLINENEIDCGDEVFIAGLFKHYVGNIKNSPIIRIGNISLMPREIINVHGNPMEAYLIESRSTSGLSGSPVFVNLGDIRRIQDQVKYAQGEQIPPLFGLIYGHFDSTDGEMDTVISIKLNNNQTKINAGIAIVTPVNKLKEILDLAKMKLAQKMEDRACIIC